MYHALPCGGQVGDSYVHKRRRLDPRLARETAWTTCSLSGEPLEAPIVSCALGQLYNQAGPTQALA